MGVAFYAEREAQEGVTPAVLKVVRPEIVGSAGPTAHLMIQKEAIALGRLNERVPSTPFVVRFLDTGMLPMPSHAQMVLPWIALEYVHGGTEGTTLEERVTYCVRHTRFGFDPARAAHAIECIAAGLAAIHEVGVIHRDITPGNVLCCGFGASEIFKIADFGIARPSGVTATFGSVMLGTPGYAPPEQCFPSATADAGPWTDVFSFACLVYYLLTGEQYFRTNNFGQSVLLIRDTKRRSVLEAPALSPEIRENALVCRAVDLALARATTMNTAERFPDAHMFASSLVAPLRATAGPRSQRASDRYVASVANRRDLATLSGWTWTIRHPPGDDRLVRSVAWDGDAHCLAVTIDGLAFWNGTAWLPVRARFGSGGDALTSVHLVRPGQWLVGGKRGLFALLGTDGSERLFHGPDHEELALVAGDPDDLAVVVAETPDGRPWLRSVAAGRFFKPVPLGTARVVSSMARVDDTRFLLCGRTTHGAGFAAVYSALDFEVTFVPAPPSDAFTACAGHVDRALGVAAGRGGATIRFDGSSARASRVEGGHDLASAAMDVQGRAWVGGAGRLWSEDADPGATWRPAWQNTSWRTPFVAIHADVGVVTAVTVDGAIVEGRTMIPARSLA
jgi:hypothetical protein